MLLHCQVCIIITRLTLHYPCFCLCLVFVQITRTMPLRRTILQFSQIRRTLARTFMTDTFSQPAPNRRIDLYSRKIRLSSRRDVASR